MNQPKTPIDLSGMLRIKTHALHRRAERSGVIADMLSGRVSQHAYALFLRNLLPAYQAMEIGLESHRQTPGVGEMARREVYRSSSLEADLTALGGLKWREALPLLPAGERYAACVATAAKGDGVELIGHAYVRYFGDLSGGQILKRLLSQSLKIKPTPLSFYDFPDVGDIAEYKQLLRAALNRSTCQRNNERVTEAAIQGFSLNMLISESVCSAAASVEIDMRS